MTITVHAMTIRVHAMIITVHVVINTVHAMTITVHDMAITVHVMIITVPRVGQFLDRKSQLPHRHHPPLSRSLHMHFMHCDNHCIGISCSLIVI